MSASSDEVMVPQRCSNGPGERPGGRKRGRPTCVSQLGQDGPPRLAVIVSLPGGRWAREMSQCPSRARRLHEAIEPLARTSGQELLPVGDGPVIMGLGVVKWHMAAQASHEHSLCLMDLAKSAHRQKHGMRFVEHEFLGSALLWARTPPPDGWDRMLRFHAGRACIEHLRARRELLTCNGRQLTVDDVIESWARQWDITLADAVLWALEPRLARALASGKLWGDVSPVAMRGQALHAPVMPPGGLLRAWRQGAEAVPPAALADTSERCTPGPGGRAVVGQAVPSPEPPRVPIQGSGACSYYYSAEQAIRALRSVLHLKNKGQAKENVRSCLRFLFPSQWEKMLGEAEVSLEDMPSRWTLRRLVVRLDCAWMLHRRACWAGQDQGQEWRHISFDASPQGGRSSSSL